MGLCCCFCCWTQAFSSGRKQGLLFIVAWQASHCGGFSLQSMASRHAGFGSCSAWLRSCSLRALVHRLSSCDTQAWLLCDMWDLPGPRIEPLSLVSQGGFLITRPPFSQFLLITSFIWIKQKKKIPTVEPIILYIIPVRNLPSKHQRHHQLCKNLHLN